MNIKMLLLPAIILAIAVSSFATYAGDCPEQSYSAGEASWLRVCINREEAVITFKPMIPYWYIGYLVEGPAVRFTYFPDSPSDYSQWTVRKPLGGSDGQIGECWRIYKIWWFNIPPLLLASTKATACEEVATAVHLIGFWPVKDGSSKIRFTWKTGVEVGTIGFRLALVTDQGQNYEDLGELIPATGTNGLPQTYSYVWEGSHQGKFALIEIEKTGNSSVIAEREVVEPPRVFIGPGGVSAVGDDDLYDIQVSHDLISWETWRSADRPGEVYSSSFREGEMTFFRARLVQ